MAEELLLHKKTDALHMPFAELTNMEELIEQIGKSIEALNIGELEQKQSLDCLPKSVFVEP